MSSDQSKPSLYAPEHEEPSAWADARRGVRQGLWYATAFSVFVLAMAVLRGSTRYPEVGLNTGQIVAFYYGAGIVGGAVFGLLRPLRNRYLGRFLSAYLVLFLVYGGGTAVFLPNMSRGDADPVPLRKLLLLWAILCLVLAPIYVFMLRKHE